jgi:hypothetical protein
VVHAELLGHATDHRLRLGRPVHPNRTLTQLQRVLPRGRHRQGSSHETHLTCCHHSPHPGGTSSTGNAEGQRKARAKRLAKAAEDLEKLQRSAGGHHYATADKILARIAVITKSRRVTGCLRTAVTSGHDGKPALTWAFDSDVLAAEAAADGWYSLITTLTPQQADAAEVFRRYKGQGVVERRYSEFKGPLAVAPLFLEHNRRITALITVICLALLVYCLIERHVRQALGPEQTMAGLYPDNRKVRPTGRMILYHLEDLMLRPGTATDPPVILINRGIQAHLLELLGIDETRPRWLETYSPCAKSPTSWLLRRRRAGRASGMSRWWGGRWPGRSCPPATAPSRSRGRRCGRSARSVR